MGRWGWLFIPCLRLAPRPPHPALASRDRCDGRLELAGVLDTVLPVSFYPVELGTLMLASVHKRPVPQCPLGLPPVTGGTGAAPSDPGHSGKHPNILHPRPGLRQGLQPGAPCPSDVTAEIPALWVRDLTWETDPLGCPRFSFAKGDRGHLSPGEKVRQHSIWGCGRVPR